MKIIQFGDIHVNDARIQEFEQLLKQLAIAVRNESPDIVIFTGDMFMHRDKLSPKQVELTREFFNEELKNFTNYLIPGNHDTSMSELKVDSLSAIFTADSESQTQIFNKVGDYRDNKNIRFHFFPYPSRKELTRLNITDIAEFYDYATVKNLFTVDENKINILIFHGTLEEAAMSDQYRASEESLGVGKDLVIPKKFWKKFDHIMAGHLHGYQTLNTNKGNAIYAGVPFPLNFADCNETGFVIWQNFDPKFIQIKQLYPYTTVNVGGIQDITSVMENITNRINTEIDYTNHRIRFKYKINEGFVSEINHAKISEYFKAAKDIKIVPSYFTVEKKLDDITIDDFQNNTIHDLIYKYIDKKKLHPKVKEIADIIEKEIEGLCSVEEEQGIHFALKSIQFSNFKCFGEDLPKIEFDKLEKVVGVLGPNRAGKSSLIEVILWGLFGQTTRNKIVTSVIRHGANSVQVEIEFFCRNAPYKIIRSRSTTKKARLSLFRYIEGAWKDISAADAITTQKSIENLVGTFDMFTSTVYSPQNGIDLLVKKKPSERKQIILDCLQIEVLKHRSDAITDLKKKTNTKITELKGAVSAFSAQITELLAASPHDAVKEFQKLLDGEEVSQERSLTQLRRLENALASYIDLEHENKEINEKVAVLRKNIEDLRNKILIKKSEKEKLEGILADKSVIDAGIEREKNCAEQLRLYADEKIRNTERHNLIEQYTKEITKVSNNINETIDAIENTRQVIHQQITENKLIDCPRSDCPLNLEINTSTKNLRIKLDDLSNKIAELTSKREIQVQQLKQKIIEVQTSLDNSFYSGAKYMEFMQAVGKEKENKWQELKHKISAGQDIIENVVELLRALQDQLTGYRRERDEYLERRIKIAEKLAEYEQTKLEITNVRSDITKHRERINQYKTQIYRFNRDIEQVAKLQKDIDKYNERHKTLSEYAKHCDTYATIVGKSGVIYVLVDKALPILENFAQQLLENTTGGTISIYIESFKTLTSGRKTDEVSIFLSDAKGKRDVLEGSGAETVLISLALRAAMSHLLSLRQGSKVELFVIDEGMGALDEDNIVVIKDMLTQLGEVFNKLLFITHIAELKDVAQSVIRLKTNGLISTYTITGETSNA